MVPCHNSEKFNDPISRKHPDVRRKRWIDPFHRILLATAMDLTSKTAENWHFKVKDIKYDVGLTKSSCITVSMQKISSDYKLI